MVVRLRLNRAIQSAAQIVGIPQDRLSSLFAAPKSLAMHNLLVEQLTNWSLDIHSGRKEGAAEKFDKIAADAVRLPKGPGTELVAMFAKLGIPGCRQCKTLAAKMDQWGVEGSRQHREEILAEIRERQGRMGLVTLAKAVVMGAVSGLAWKVDLSDTAAWFVDEAIRRAEEKENVAGRLPETSHPDVTSGDTSG